MSDGRKLQQKRQMRHLCSNRLAFSFSTSIWRGLNLSVPYWLWCDNLKKRWHAKAFEIQNDPTRSASLINLFGLDRGVHFLLPISFTRIVFSLEISSVVKSDSSVFELTKATIWLRFTLLLNIVFTRSISQGLIWRYGTEIVLNSLGVSSDTPPA